MTQQGIICKFCGCRDSHVTHTSQVEFKYQGRLLVRIRRRRVCRYCKLPYTTVETYESEDTIGQVEGAPGAVPLPSPLSSPEKNPAPGRLAAKRNPYL